MGELFSYIVDLLLPPRKTEQVVRRLTQAELLSLDAGDGLPYHDPRVTALIWELKYYGTRRAAALAGEHLAETLLAAAAEELGTALLVPVPMHAARRQERGHNQTELLCAAALFALRRHGEAGPVLEYSPKALARTVHTRHQQGLPRQERLGNVRNSMNADGKIVAGRVCIVVDDVTTTGATLQEAKRALTFAGARAVHTVALARS